MATTQYPYAHLSDDALTEAAYAAYRDIDQLESSIRLGWTSAEVRQALAEAQTHLRELVEEANDRMHRQQLEAEQREDALRCTFGPPIPDPDLPF